MCIDEKEESKVVNKIRDYFSGGIRDGVGRVLAGTNKQKRLEPST